MSAKFPRICHLPWSPGGTNDDKRLQSVDHFLGDHLVFTEKLDGSNLCMTRSDLFARSHSGPPAHPSFDLAKALHAQIRWSIPGWFSVFGEWCYAVHSIEYEALPAYFHVFGVRNDDSGEWSSWDHLGVMCKSWGLTRVPLLHQSHVSSAKELQDLVERFGAEPSVYGGEREGVVIRVARHFRDDQFHLRCAKWVRADHVQTDDHWKHQEIRKQGLKT